MKAAHTYRTVAGISRSTFRDRGSRFIAIVHPVESEEEIRKILEGIRRKYHTARHHCYAYVLGISGEVTRAADEGEPAGSAGKPILNQIRVQSLTNILVVVIRFFGGTLLGVGGLVNAYKNASAGALHKARIITRTVKNRYRLQFGYPQLDNVMSATSDKSVHVINRDFGEGCILIVEIPADETTVWLKKMERIKGLTILPLTDE